jgi:hypothetical protein
MLYGTANTHIFYATTHYEGPLFARPVNARVVLLLRSEYARDDDGVARITSVMDAFIKIDHLTANLVARTMSPVVGRTADHNFVESFRFLARVSQTAEENGPGVQQLAMKLDRCDAATRQLFADVAGAVAERAVARTATVVPPNAQISPSVSTATPVSTNAPTSTEAATGAQPTRGLQLRR